MADAGAQRHDDPVATEALPRGSAYLGRDRAMAMPAVCRGPVLACEGRRVPVENGALRELLLGDGLDLLEPRLLARQLLGEVLDLALVSGGVRCGDLGSRSAIAACNWAANPVARASISGFFDVQ